MVTTMQGRLMLLMQILGLALASDALHPSSPPDCSLLPPTPSFHPHETERSLYYLCDRGIRSTFACKQDQIFNVESQKCVNTKTFENLPPCADPSTCGINDQGLLKPYPTNCTMYVYCSFGVPLPRSCATGEHFSPGQSKCMAEGLANCPLCEGAETTTPIIVNTTTTEATTRTMFTITTPTSTTTVPTTVTMVTVTPTPSIPPCNAIPSCGLFENGISKPYPPDCTHYVYCLFGNAEIRMCDEGLHFSASEKICTTPSLANCPQCID